MAHRSNVPLQVFSGETTPVLRIDLRSYLRDYNFLKLRSSSIKPLFLNVGLYLRGNEIPDRFSLPHQFPDLGRGDIEKRDLLHIEAVSRAVDPGFLYGIVLEKRIQTLWKFWDM